MVTSDPKILLLAFLGGIAPALLWLWFWIREEQNKSEPKRILALVFIMGMTAVIFVLPIQKFIQAQVNFSDIQFIIESLQININSHNIQLILWAGSEEIIKYIAVMIILFRTNYADEPVDWPIYLMTAALGFAALENTLFLIKPLSSTDATTVGLLTGQLRFLGSTLLHTVSSGILGIALGISMHMDKLKKKLYPVIGLIFAIALHSIFNFFIIRANGDNGNDLWEVLRVFGFLWVVTVVVMLMFEKVRRMS